MRVRPVELKDRKAWADLRATLWPDQLADELAHETLQHFVHKPLAELVLVAEGTSGRLLGFLELSLRAYAEGCATTPVPFIEGWYVTTDARHQGVGRRLVEVAEDWSRMRGFTEIASDTQLSNQLGQEAHAGLGFEEAERLVSFRKSLKP
jgi:aminoglycoside 6'-N-acetyltransferase I